jgi:hypothetical protein
MRFFVRKSVDTSLDLKSLLRACPCSRYYYAKRLLAETLGVVGDRRMPYALAATGHVWQATRMQNLSWLTLACRWVRRNVLIDFRLQQVQRLDLNRLVLPV